MNIIIIIIIIIIITKDYSVQNTKGTGQVLYLQLVRIIKEKEEKKKCFKMSFENIN